MISGARCHTWNREYRVNENRSVVNAQQERQRQKTLDKLHGMNWSVTLVDAIMENLNLVTDDRSWARASPKRNG